MPRILLIFQCCVALLCFSTDMTGENTIPPSKEDKRSFSLYGGLLFHNLDDRFELDKEATTGYLVGLDKTFGNRFYLGTSVEFESLSGGFGSSGTEPYRLSDVGAAIAIGTQSSASSNVHFFFDVGFKYQFLINSNPEYQGRSMVDKNYGVPLRLGLGSKLFYVTARAFTSLSNIFEDDDFRLNTYSVGLGVRF